MVCVEISSTFASAFRMMEGINKSSLKDLHRQEVVQERLALLFWYDEVSRLKRDTNRQLE